MRTNNNGNVHTWWTYYKNLHPHINLTIYTCYWIIKLLQFPNKNNKLPVVVWTYGGAFYTGSPGLETGRPDSILEENVLVVSFNYRVGVFGFLSTGESVLPGNAGLKDQVLALQWIKDNIEHFGGDPEKITLMGQSAGAASIGYLLQAPQTNGWVLYFFAIRHFSYYFSGLYSAAIMLSGSSLNPWSLSSDPLTFTKSVASSLNIATTNIRQMIEKLKLVDPEELLKQTDPLYNSVSCLKRKNTHIL